MPKILHKLKKITQESLNHLWNVASLESHCKLTPKVTTVELQGVPSPYK